MAEILPEPLRSERGSASSRQEQCSRLLLVFLPLALIVAGLLVWRLLPASLDQVRADSQEELVENNLRLFVAAAHQFMLDEYVNEADYEDIVGPGKRLGYLDSVAGESYAELALDVNTKVVQVELGDGRVVAFEFAESTDDLLRSADE